MTPASLPPELVSRLHWDQVWLSIADEHLAAAQSARSRLLVDRSSESLNAEFRHALTSIAASAFAVDSAIVVRFGPNTNVPVNSTPIPPGRRLNGRPLNWGDYLGQYFIEAGSTDVRAAHRLGDLVALRHDSVHPSPRSSR